MKLAQACTRLKATGEEAAFAQGKNTNNTEPELGHDVGPDGV